MKTATGTVVTNVVIRTLREDPVQATEDVIAHAIAVVGKDGAQITPGKVGHTTTIFFPDASPESTSFDGMVRRDATESFSTLRGGNGTSNDTATDPQTFANIIDDPDNVHFSEIRRGNFVFNTASLADTDVVSSATLSLRGTAKKDNLSITPDLDIVQAVTASNSAGTNTDYQNMLATVFGSVTYSGYSTSGYNDIVLNASGIANVSVTSVSKFGARTSNDVTNTAPAVVGGGTETETAFTANMAEASATSTDPMLTIVSAPPAAGGHPRSYIMFHLSPFIPNHS